MYIIIHVWYDRPALLSLPVHSSMHHWTKAKTPVNYIKLPLISYFCTCVLLINYHAIYVMCTMVTIVTQYSSIHHLGNYRRAKPILHIDRKIVH